ncbi:MAG: cobalamin biosynthesis protein [Mycobacteriales bacterium]
MPARSGRALGLLLGSVLDAAFADPRRGHPVAVFGRAATALERRLWADARARGIVHSVLCTGTAGAAGGLLERSTRGTRWHVAATAAATWAVLGGATLAREATTQRRLLERSNLPAARAHLPSLCGRDPAGLGPAELARAAVESVAENTSDAVVAPLWWGALAGMPGLLAYRAVNTLDAMVGHRGARYGRFGWAAARLDDVANLAPARLTGLLAAVLAPAVGGSPAAAWRTMARDGAAHPSPNAGRCEAAFAGALGVRLGGTNVYGDRIERRGPLGEGRAPEPADIARAVRLSRLVGATAAVLAAAVAAAVAAVATRRGRAG